ncbi:MAG: C40 family peptidase [Bacteroidales bacterium]|nr:C40 family peptidase [Bacteroidales bacterium]
MKFHKGLIAGVILLISACNTPKHDCRSLPDRKDLIRYSAGLDSLSAVLVPDKREGIIDARLSGSGSNPILKGETDQQTVKDEIVAFLTGKGLQFTDSLNVLPDTSVIKKQWALVNVSVCNIRSEPSHAAELVSQAVMGTPVRILKVHRGWYFIQTPDLYLGWVDAEGIFPMGSGELQRWKDSPRIIYLPKTGDIYDEPSGNGIVSDIVAGSILEAGDAAGTFTRVMLPDGRSGFIPKSDTGLLDNWLSKTEPSPENLLKTARSFMGIPYLWGGTSVKGFDCSGFVKMIYCLNGIILARDASLQFRHGIRLGRSAYPDSLITGDLLFFGSERDGVPRPTHVGMYIGDTEFIHASGMVKINSLDSARANFSRGRRDSFLGVRRISGAVPGEGLQLVSGHNWYIDN